MSLKKIILLFVLQLGRRVLFGGVGFPYSWVSDSMDSILLANLHKWCAGSVRMGCPKTLCHTYIVTYNLQSIYQTIEDQTTGT